MGRAMSPRWSLALGLSVLVHLALIALGLGLGARRFTGPVDIEITGMRLDEVKDLPLGGPAGGHGAGHAAHRAHHRVPPPDFGAIGSQTTSPGPARALPKARTLTKDELRAVEED